MHCLGDRDRANDRPCYYLQVRAIVNWNLKVCKRDGLSCDDN